MKPHLHTTAFDKQSARTVDEQGFLHVADCNISKATVNPYWGAEIPDYQQLGLDPQKTYYLFRDPKELAKAADTFNNLPLMDNHVEVSAFDLENPDIASRVVGSTGTDAKFQDPYLVNDLVVWKASAIQGVMTKEQTQLSCAYRYDLDMTPGTYQGQHYDGRMMNIRGNHVALVDEGRAGPDVTVKDRKSQSLAERVRAAMAKDDGIGKIKQVLSKGGAKDADPDLIDGLIDQLTQLKATITEKLKPSASDADGKVLDDCTSAIDLAVHHLLDFKEDADEASKDVMSKDANPDGVNQYTGGLSAKAAEHTAKAAGHEKRVSELTQKARTGGISKEELGKLNAHRAAASAHREAAGNYRYAANNPKEGKGQSEQQHYLKGWSEAANRASKMAGDSSIATDKIAHVPGHKDSSGKAAPWVIKSETTGKVLWSGASKADAVKNLARIEGHKQHANDRKERNMSGINTDVSPYAKVRGAFAKDIAERKDVSKQAGITQHGNVEFADPKNKKYPIDTPEHVRAALSYWGRAKNRNEYSKEDQDTITKRITAAAKRMKIGEYAESK